MGGGGSSLWESQRTYVCILLFCYGLCFSTTMVVVVLQELKNVQYIPYWYPSLIALPPPAEEWMNPCEHSRTLGAQMVMMLALSSLSQSHSVVGGPLQVDVMPSYRDQIPDDAFSMALVIVPEDDEDTGSSFTFQEQDQVKVGPAATQQGRAGGGR